MTQDVVVWTDETMTRELSRRLAASSFPDALVVELEPHRIMRAKRRADAQMRKHTVDRGDFMPYSGPPRHLRLTWARMAVEAVAQILDTATPPRDLKVQWAPQAPARAFLKIPANEIEAQPEKRWVLVTGREPKFMVIGGIRAREASSLGEWRADVRRPAWYVEAQRLHAGVGRSSDAN